MKKLNVIALLIFIITYGGSYLQFLLIEPNEGNGGAAKASLAIFTLFIGGCITSFICLISITVSMWQRRLSEIHPLKSTWLPAMLGLPPFIFMGWQYVSSNM